MQPARQIAIVGAGTTGTEIAHAMVLGGDQVILHDTDARALRLALAQISRGLDHGVRLRKIDPWLARKAKRAFLVSTDLRVCARADVIIEAVHDQLVIKQALFQTLDTLVGPEVILATSSNTLSVTKLAAATRLPDRLIGLHFFRPAYLMPLVEVVRSPNTRQEVIDEAAALVRRIDKTPLIVPDTPGQIVNRLAQAYFGEALHLLDGGSLDEKTVDRLMEAAGFPMGPFRLMDYLGVDKTFEIAQAIYEATFHAAHYRPNPRQLRLVEAGRIGRGSRRGGFYPKVEQD